MSLCRDMMPAWELRAAMENAEAKVVEQADRIAQLEAALRAIRRGAVWNADIEAFISAALEERT